MNSVRRVVLVADGELSLVVNVRVVGIPEIGDGVGFTVEVSTCDFSPLLILLLSVAKTEVGNALIVVEGEGVSVEAQPIMWGQCM